MAHSLHALLHAIAYARDERELRLAYMDRVAEHFGVQRWGIYLLDEQSCLTEVDVHGLPDVFVERYEEVGRAVDPVMRYVAKNYSASNSASQASHKSLTSNSS